MSLRRSVGKSVVTVGGDFIDSYLPTSAGAADKIKDIARFQLQKSPLFFSFVVDLKHNVVKDDESR